VDSSEYFQKVAGEWDRMRRDFFSEAVRDKACQVAGVKAGDLAADIGAGTGFVTEGLLERGARVVAVDRSKAMLDQLRARFSGRGSLECRLGESEALPLETGTIDCALANMYLHHVEDPGRSIGEMASILAPGGRLVITDLDEHGFEFLRIEHCDRWMGFKRADVRRWLELAGLRDVLVDCVGAECCAASARGCASARVTIFVASGTKG
jgi:ubiquinone/menaquinone biosynthesis C-methylase UbiE